MNKHKKSVLILGGAGFIGYNIAKYLVKNSGYNLTIVDDFSSGILDKDLKLLCDNYFIKVVNSDLSQSDCFKSFDDYYDDVYVISSVVGVNSCIE
jgi:nucleoside-diphosphate-sugar epimerase